MYSENLEIFISLDSFSMFELSFDLYQSTDDLLVEMCYFTVFSSGCFCQIYRSCGMAHLLSSL